MNSILNLYGNCPKTADGSNASNIQNGQPSSNLSFGLGPDSFEFIINTFDASSKVYMYSEFPWYCADKFLPSSVFDVVRYMDFFPHASCLLMSILGERERERESM